MQDLKGKVAVVTGAASGIGRAMAEAFAAEGARVVLADIEETALGAVAAAMKQQRAELLCMRNDVTQPNQVYAIA